MDQIVMAQIAMAQIAMAMMKPTLLYWTMVLLAIILTLVIWTIQSVSKQSAMFSPLFIQMTLAILGVSLLLIGTVNLFPDKSLGWILTGVMILIFASIWFIVAKLIWQRGKALRAHTVETPSKIVALIFNQMSDLVLIMDYRGIVVNVNRPDLLSELFPNCKRFVDLVGYFGTDALKDHLSDLNRAITFPFDYFDGKLARPINGKFFNLRLVPIVEGETRLGFSAVLTNITETVLHAQTIKNSNDLLSQANVQLESKLHIETRLAEEKARLSVLASIQRTLIDDIERVAIKTKELEVQRNEGSDIQAIQRGFLNLAEKIREVYQKVRRAVWHMSNNDRT